MKKIRLTENELYSVIQRVVLESSDMEDNFNDNAIHDFNDVIDSFNLNRFDDGVHIWFYEDDSMEATMKIDKYRRIIYIDYSHIDSDEFYHFKMKYKITSKYDFERVLISWVEEVFGLKINDVKFVDNNFY